MDNLLGLRAARITVLTYKLRATIAKYEVFFVSLLFIIVILFTYRDVVFMGKSFLTGSGLEGVTQYGPYGFPIWDPVETRFYGPDAGATAWFMEPQSRVINHMYRSGELPLWNPHTGLGFPIYANPQSGAFDPLLLLEHIAPEALWPSMVDFHVLLLHFLASIFTFLFLRELGIHPVAAVVGALGFICSSYFFIYTNISFARADFLIPLLFYSYHRLATGFSRWVAVQAIFSLWLILITGFIETVPLHLSAAGLWYGFVVLLEMRHTGSRLRWLIHKIAHLVFVVSASFLLAAFIVLPFIELALLGEHTHGPKTNALPLSLSQIVQFFIRFIIPLPGEPVLINYSIGVLVLGLYSLTHWRNSRGRLYAYGRFFALTSVMMILITMYVPVFVKFHNLPIFNMILLLRNLPPIALFYMACAAGISLNIMLMRGFRPLVIVAIGVSLLLPVFAYRILQGEQFTAWDMKLPIQPMIMVVCVLILLFTISWMAHFELVRRKTAAYLVAALLIFSPTEWHEFAVRPARYDPFTSAPFVEFLQKLDQPYRMIALDGLLFLNIPAVFGLDDVRYLDGVFPGAYANYLRNLGFTPSTTMRFTGYEKQLPFNRSLDLLNVEYIVAARTDSWLDDRMERDPALAARLEKVYEDNVAVIYRNPNALPRAFMVYDLRFAASTDQAVDLLGTGAVEPAQTVILQGDIPAAVLANFPPQQEPGQAEVVVTDRTYNTMTIEVESDTAGLLVLSEQFYPGWYAEVDGEKSDIFQANGTMRAVYLEPGSHTVYFYFMPRLFVIGVALGAVTLLLLLIWLCLPAIRKSLQRASFKPTQLATP